MAAAISRTPMDSLSLIADDHDFISRRHVEPRHVDRRHVHADRADNRGAAASDQHPAVPGQAAIEAVGVAGGHDGDRHRTIDAAMQTVADPLAGPDPLHVHDTGME